ncbi:pyridoxine 5'-phosphate synthase [Candidatus Dependentiae bacterium]|nr:pyridoxine 5'-phosphate synthase [Candidatus Dependentiae bacterium]
MIRLSVNIDHVATLRNARGEAFPDPIFAASIALASGANGITVHLREDRRHIKDRDLNLLKEIVHNKLNLEMGATEELLKIAKKLKPEMCTLVPEKRKELTTEGGLDVIKESEHLKKYIKSLHNSEILVSLFIDPDKKQIDASKEVGADYIEIHTGLYANATNPEERQMELEKVRLSAEFAFRLGLKVNAGHGLNYDNLPDIAAIPEIEEVSIGHYLIGSAILLGLPDVIKKTMDILNRK